VGALFFVLAWTALSLPLGMLVGNAIAEMDRDASRWGRNLA
jgi:hypothetical protein